jgi:hypothetical protein
MRILDLPHDAPPQHGPGQCRLDLGGCGRPLSTYNPYVVCGPCRVRLAAEIAREEAAEAEAAEEAVGVKEFAWERFPKRHVVRRGALLAETGGAKVAG